MLPFDPIQLDRTLSKFAERFTRFTVALRRGTAAEHAFELLPAEFSGERLPALWAAAKVDPQSEPALRWLRYLLVEHACIEALGRVAEELRARRHQTDLPERGGFTIAEMRRRALRDAARGSDWLRVLAERAGDLRARRFELWALRSEHYQRLGATPVLVGDKPQPTLELADRVLALTDDAFGELRPRTLQEYVQAGLGLHAVGDYPAQLSARNLADLISEGGLLDGLDPKLEELPEPWGASSWMRGLCELGRAIHDGAASRHQLFALSHDPRGLRRSVWGSLFALLPNNRAFAERRLGVSKPWLRDHQRNMTQIILLAMRAAALRALLSRASWNGAASYDDCFANQVPRALGFELPRGAAGVLFVDDRALPNFEAHCAALAQSSQLIEAHDQDWFRNPRAIEELREEADSVPYLELEPQHTLDGVERLVATIAECW